MLRKQRKGLGWALAAAAAAGGAAAIVLRVADQLAPSSADGVADEVEPAPATSAKHETDHPTPDLSEERHSDHHHHSEENGSDQDHSHPSEAYNS
jgi:NAD(P)-dependent dehydrogenase (short-subunit alcohol dehydrogenase family)